MTEKEALQQATDAMNLIDQNTTRSAAAVTSVQSRIDDLLGQIAASDNLADAQALAAKAADINARSGAIADALTAMGTSVSNPVPVPVPEPEPVVETP
jgi:hypothetical protein